MKTLFIEAKYHGKISLNRIPLNRLPNKVGLVSSVQFSDNLPKIKTYLEKHNKKVFLEKAKQKYKGQVLGCDITAAKKIEKDVDSYLYIGDGRFHPLGVALKTNKKVYTFNPIGDTFSEINENEINKTRQRNKGKLLKFLTSDKIGILVSVKPGQHNLKKALTLKNKYKDKEFSIFLFDTLNPNDLENFPFIKCWVNTACPRISDEKNIINIDYLDSL